MNNNITSEQLEKEMSHAPSEFYFIRIYEEPAGYLKVNVEWTRTRKSARLSTLDIRSTNQDPRILERSDELNSAHDKIPVIVTVFFCFATEARSLQENLSKIWESCGLIPYSGFHEKVCGTVHTNRW